VTQAFVLSPALTKFLMGPLGGGKTTTCIFARLTAATMAPVAIHPATRKKTRMCRWLVVRDTFRSVEKSVLETWKASFPKGFPGSSWAGGNDRPVTHILRFIGKDGIPLEVITEFVGIGDQKLEVLMRGREYSGVWLNEADTMVKGVLDDAEQRVGRYPSRTILVDPEAARMKVVLGDLNAPTVDNWVYEVFIKRPTPDRVFFQQPGALEPDAENLFALEDDYYSRIIDNQDQWFVDRMVNNKFGYSRGGKPVHPAFVPTRHIARQTIKFNARRQLVIGADVSTNTLNCAAVFIQVNENGGACAIDEIVPGHGVGPARFGEAVKNRLNERYSDARLVKFYADPASEQGGDKEGGQLAALDILRAILEIPILIPGGGSNELAMRLEAVNTELRGYLEPNSHFQLSKDRCPILLEAFLAKYRFRKLSDAASNEFEDKPEKSHPWSDVMDGLQYGLVGLRGRHRVISAASGKSENGRGIDTFSRGRFSGSSTGSSPWGKVPGGFDPHKC
ncbi:MAG: hypothetical protein JKY92_09365, partial [Magnetovibrio sp.]|nr:hypothetical protein [Magnetovibrio sp.]